MNTVACKRCDLVNLDTSSACKRCGARLEVFTNIHTTSDPGDSGIYPAETAALVDVHAAAAVYQQPFAVSSSRPMRRALPYATHLAKKKGLAVLSLVLGIIAMPPVSLLVGGVIVWLLAYFWGTFGTIIGVLLVLLTIPGGIASGIAALVKANRMPGTYGGKGVAIAGVAISFVAFLTVPLIAAVAIPNLMAARRAANEGTAVAAMQRIAAAQLTYTKAVGNGYCAEIPTLGGLTLIDMETAKGERNGYLFYVTSLPGGGCEIHGVPKSWTEGDRSFFFSTNEKLLRAGLKKGLPAGPSDPLVGATGRAPMRQSSTP